MCILSRHLLTIAECLMKNVVSKSAEWLKNRKNAACMCIRIDWVWFRVSFQQYSNMHVTDVYTVLFIIHIIKIHTFFSIVLFLRIFWGDFTPFLASHFCMLSSSLCPNRRPNVDLTLSDWLSLHHSLVRINSAQTHHITHAHIYVRLCCANTKSILVARHLICLYFCIFQSIKFVVVALCLHCLLVCVCVEGARCVGSFSVDRRLRILYAMLCTHRSVCNVYVFMVNK